MRVRALGTAVGPLLLALLVALTLPPIGTATSAPLAAPHPVAPFSQGALERSAAPPPVTTLFDWDPQPFILPPAFPADQIAGEGAVATTSDPLGTVLLFGGESPEGLTNLTITASQATANWNTAAIPVGPSPRANASLATIDGGRFAVLFGGLTSLATGATDNQTWLYDYRNRTWTNETGAIAPPARESAAFAADDRAGIGVLWGGLSPSTSLNGGGATVTWNDTWFLNLTTLAWSRANVSGAPRPMFGASMVADPISHAFELFGGCAAFCSGTLYQLRPGGNWTVVPVTGDLPPPRGGASLAWSATWNLTILFGGFEWGGNTYAPLNDSYVYDPTLRAWSLNAGGGPSARFAAAATYLDNNQCPGFLVLGGSSALTQPPADGWFMDSNPDYGNGCNNWGGDQVGGPGGGGGGNCTVTNSLEVQILNSSSDLGLPGANVTLTGSCGSVTRTTGPGGFANFTALPNETVKVVASAVHFHSNQTYLNLSVNVSNHLTMFLTPLPVLYIRTIGESYPVGLAPLGNVSVVYGSLLPLGNSSAEGYLNVSGFPGASGPGTFFAYAPGYQNTSVQENIPYTGTLTFSITLRSDGAFDVHVVEWPDLLGVAGSTGVITPVGAYTYGGPVAFTTNGQGWFNATLPQANYTVRAVAPGFYANVSSPRFHPWVAPTIVVVNLTAQFASNLSVQLVDAHSGMPIVGGTVVLGLLRQENTTAGGWANFSNIRPPGEYGVAGSAPGYAPNSTSVDLSYQNSHPVVTLHLTPLNTCPPTCATKTNGTGGTYRLLPGSGATLDLFALAPVALALAGAVYVIYLRRRAETTR